MGNNKFPKQMRLLKPTDFERVFNQKCSAADGMIVVYAAENKQTVSRLGLVVSKKCGNAVQRNLWKRSLREAFRLIQNDLPQNFDFVVLPRPKAIPNVERLQKSLLKLATKSTARIEVVRESTEASDG